MLAFLGGSGRALAGRVFLRNVSKLRPVHLPTLFVMPNFIISALLPLRLTVVAALLAALSCPPAAADDAIIFNPSTYLIDGRLVLTPTPDMIVWDRGIATRVGSVWVGDGGGRYPGGRGALTTRMQRRAEQVEAEAVATPRYRIRTDRCHDCECQLLMWRSWP